MSKHACRYCGRLLTNPAFHEEHYCHAKPGFVEWRVVTTCARCGKRFTPTGRGRLPSKFCSTLCQVRTNRHYARMGPSQRRDAETRPRPGPVGCTPVHGLDFFPGCDPRDFNDGAITLACAARIQAQPITRDDPFHVILEDD